VPLDEFGASGLKAGAGPSALRLPIQKC
jgi:hypothetical protein